MKKFDTWLLFLYYNAMITSEYNIRITVRIDCYIFGKQVERGRYVPSLSPASTHASDVVVFG